MDGLEEQLVAVNPLLGALLEREEIVGAEVALVVARALTREDGLRVVLRSAGRHGGSILLGVSDLFSDAARERLDEAAPLALRLRPQALDEFVGQEQVLGEGSALRLAIAEDRVGSMILYGPPGSGKTTLARIVADTDRRRLRGALRGLGVGRPGARRCSPARATGSAAPGSGRSSSWTRSTASTRRSRTRCCRPSRRGC